MASAVTMTMSIGVVLACLAAFFIVRGILQYVILLFCYTIVLPSFLV
jgi:hypothetical protein